MDYQADLLITLLNNS